MIWHVTGEPEHSETLTTLVPDSSAKPTSEESNILPECGHLTR